MIWWGGRGVRLGEGNQDACPTFGSDGFDDDFEALDFADADWGAGLEVAAVDGGFHLAAGDFDGAVGAEGTAGDAFIAGADGGGAEGGGGFGEGAAGGGGEGHVFEGADLGEVAGEEHEEGGGTGDADGEVAEAGGVGGEGEGEAGGGGFGGVFGDGGVDGGDFPA